MAYGNFNDPTIPGLIAKIAEARELTPETERLAVACSQGTKRFDPSPWGQSGIFRAFAREGSICFIAERAASRTAQSMSLRSGITSVKMGYSAERASKIERTIELREGDKR
ncbi:MAG TPA: hypothetical protein VGM03_09105 [Phycisphaerae bacterium]|jgi:hypothetical protein